MEEGLVSQRNTEILRQFYDKAVSGTQDHAMRAIARRLLQNEKQPGSFLTLKFLMEWLSQRSGLALYHIDPLKIDVPAVTKVVSLAYATRFGILAVAANEQGVTFAVSEPFYRDWEPQLARIIGKEITRVLLSPDEIERYIHEFYSISKSVLVAQNRHVRDVARGQNFEQLVELGRKGQLDANDAHVISIVDWLLQYAFDQRASDIHLEPRREEGHVRFRIDGVLQQVYAMPAPVMAAVTSRIKIIARLDIAEKRRPQDGRIKTKQGNGTEIELRLSTMPTAFGEKLVLRIFNPETLVMSAVELGFTEQEINQWREMVTQPYGIILVTGPTGSGKTTTLYSTLKRLSTPDVNVCTVEDPIELIEPSFNQMQVQRSIGLDFASGVRTLMRQDPDIIMIGEIRDLETAEMAIQSALTGHLVLSTLHTNDAPSAITRLLDLGVPSYLLNSTVIGIMAQRLARTLCPRCKVAEPIDDETWWSFLDPLKNKGPEATMRPLGCQDCRNTGYWGRTAIMEILRLTDGLKRLIRPHCDIQQIRKQAITEGMVPLRLSGARKVAAGITTLEEVARVTPSIRGH